MDLNNKLIELPTLHCAFFREFLSLPIRTSSDNENICGYCFEKEKDEKICTVKTKL